MSCFLSAGIGAQERALRNLKIAYEVIATCDCDKDAVLSYATMRCDFDKELAEYNFPEKQIMIDELQAKNIGYNFKDKKHTITNRTMLKKVQQYYLADKLSKNLGDISKVEKLPYADLVTYSFPCFVPGTMVLTDNGYKNIEDIQEGDMVLTHTNQYQRVVKPMKNYCDSFVYKINAMCSDPIYATEEHPFYVRKKHRVSNPHERYSNGRLKRIRQFGAPEWVKAKDLTKDYYVGIAINQKSEIPQWDGIILHWSDGRKDRHSNKLGQYMDKADFWWVIGRYIGDGWLVDGYGSHPSYGIKICCAQEETSEITTVLNNLGVHYTISTDRTVNKIQISGKEWHMFCLQFGRGAANKRLTPTILNLPIHLLRSFLDGYISADGYLDKKQNAYRATSVSRELVYGLGQCVAKAYNTPFSVFKTKRSETCIIEERKVNQKDSYNIAFKIDKRKQDNAFYEDGYIWCPINDISTEEYSGYVYNMEVENDNSYVIQNIIVHNCTTVSVSGKGEGIVNKCDCGYSWPIDFSNSDKALICPKCGTTAASSTQSGLLGQVQRLLAEAHKDKMLPKYLLLENVKNLVGQKFKPQFDTWIKWLDAIGYNTYYQVLNAKSYSMPQNRERVFAVSIRKDIDDKKFQFPKTIPLKTRLKDILEQNVDEKYYLPDDRIDKILNAKITTSQEDAKDEIRVVGNYMPSGHDASRVVDVEGIAPTVKENHGTVTAIAEPQIIQKFGDRGTSQYSVRDYAHTIPANPMSDRGQMVVEPQIIKVGQVSSDGSQAGMVYSPDGLSPTICAGCHGYAMGNILEKYEPQVLRAERTEYGKAIRKQYEAGEIDEKIGNMREMKPRTDGIANTITTLLKDNYVAEPTIEKAAKEPIKLRIRKLTTKECWRLMGFTDKDHDKAMKYVSDSALYKQAGNSIVTNCLTAIFYSLFFKDNSDKYKQYLINFND